MAPKQTTLSRDLLIAGVALLVLLILPVLWPSKALSDLIIRVSAFSLFATSLNLLVGYTGMVSFGHGMFFGFGAYCFGLSMQRLGVSIPTALLLTIALTAVLAAVVGAISIRLKEIYFAFITLAFQMLLHSLIIAWVPLTGGDQGLMGGIPRPEFLGIDFGLESNRYAFSVILMIVGLLALRHVAESPFGYTLRMIRDNPERASFLGVNVFRTKLTAFIIAGIFGAVGGVIMAMFVSGAYPEFANWTMSGEGIFMVMLGGISTFLGPTVGAVILSLLNDLITRRTEHHGIFLGVIILVFALGLRKGVTDFIADWFQARRESAGAQLKGGRQ
ncbi:MAG: branched-chain amino acid ABC transporter permease [Proteobacteria bacterium]|jgi:ABC-type branched-chain amino acid transport system, permease component|nr:MAG: branched-chain amino acid ABC transporter permease [Pseudomonadota bacterium]